MTVEHLRVDVDGATRCTSHVPAVADHCYRCMAGPSGWLTWQPVMNRLVYRYTPIAPDLRGFGDSDKPAGPHMTRCFLTAGPTG